MCIYSHWGGRRKNTHREWRCVRASVNERKRKKTSEQPVTVIFSLISATLQKFWLFLTCQMVSPFRLMCYDENDKWFRYGFLHSFFASFWLHRFAFLWIFVRVFSFCFMYESKVLSVKITAPKDEVLETESRKTTLHSTHVHTNIVYTATDEYVYVCLMHIIYGIW